MIKTRDLFHGYQNNTIDFITNTSSNAVWLDMGLGKTVSSATAVSDLMAGFDVGRCLIVAPKRVALTTWPIELQSWEHLMHLRYAVIHGNIKQRTQAIMQRADFHIVSRDNLAWLVRMVGNQWPWDCVILDESSSFKSQASNRWKAMRSVLKYTRRVIELSATPAPQGLIDLWSQFYLLDRGLRLGGTENSFKKRWFYSDRHSYNITPKKHAESEIHSLVSDITIHMSAEDYLDMPELIYNEIAVEMPRQIMAKYKEFEKELVLDMSDLNVDVEVEAANAAVLTGKLLQFSNGAVYTDTLRNYEVLHDEKIEALKEILEAHSGYPIMVAYNFQSDKERIMKAIPGVKVMDDDPETQIKWNNGEIPILLTHPASSGHGLNLQKGSNILVWFGLTWSLELYYQLQGRLYRQGQTQKTVVMHHILCRDTVDYRVMQVLQRKGATQKALLDAVKAI